MVTVSLFIFTNIILIGAAVFVVSRFLYEKESILWIFPWSISAGVIITLRHCLPDGAADALVLISIIALLKKKHLIYSLFMALERV